MAGVGADGEGSHSFQPKAGRTFGSIGEEEQKSKKSKNQKK
jgi:hypothetical protein